MTSKAAKRRNKKRASEFDLAPIKKRQPNGQARERNTGASDPRKTALEARARLLGMDPGKANLAALSGQHMGAQIGLVLERKCEPEEIRRLWTTWQGFCAAERTYRIRYIGQTGDAKGAAIAMVPDRMESDQSHSVDLRDSDQRDRDAVNNWMQWRGMLMHLSAADQALIRDAETGRGADLWANTEPTRTGLATLNALRRFADVVERCG